MLIRTSLFLSVALLGAGCVADANDDGEEVQESEGALQSFNVDAATRTQWFRGERGEAPIPGCDVRVRRRTVLNALAQRLRRGEAPFPSFTLRHWERSCTRGGGCSAWRPLGPASSATGSLDIEGDTRDVTWAGHVRLEVDVMAPAPRASFGIDPSWHLEIGELASRDQYQLVRAYETGGALVALQEDCLRAVKWVRGSTLARGWRERASTLEAGRR